MKDLILASGSKRRIELLENAGFKLTVRPSQSEENLPDDITPEDAVLFLSLKKALSVEAESHDMDGEFLLAADTVVVFRDRIIGKPLDRDDALNILMALSGQTHSVLTGVTILKIGSPLRKAFFSETQVTFKKYGAGELTDYLAGDEPYDKAGAYAIQGYFAKYIESYSGEYENVVGLPIHRLLKELEALAK